MTTFRAPWATGPEWDRWGDEPVHRMAQVEAEEVLLGRVPRDGSLLPETRQILSAHDAWLATLAEPGGETREIRDETEAEAHPDPEIEL